MKLDKEGRLAALSEARDKREGWEECERGEER